MNNSRATREVEVHQSDLASTLREILPSIGSPSPIEDGLTSRNSLYSVTYTVDDSSPSSPKYGPPINFDEVAPGIYRSSFPKPSNFDHLAQLGLKTILTLVSEKEDIEYLQFIRSQGIKHHQIAIPPNKEAFHAIPLTAMAEALSVVCDARNYPMLIHCNKGKHRTGCVTGCYRKMNGWSMNSILDEYRHYAGAKARSLDEKYMAEFDERSMATMLNDIVYQKARDSYALLTPPSSDKGFKENSPQLPENVPRSSQTF
ncbi:hypothetical protein MMC10_000245 [Thelotrema lepadinum]|nr:hypothetical protein [Thelotrema lepadinum]